MNGLPLYRIWGVDRDLAWRCLRCLFSVQVGLRRAGICVLVLLVTEVETNPGGETHTQHTSHQSIQKMAVGDALPS
jgi:glutathione synthase/RimK-type ligase-like ATP-grasp enzyme